jgi:DNA-binding NtrC family response regulator
MERKMATPLRVLIVEDEDKLRRVLELHLVSEGYEVMAAGSAEEALRRTEGVALVVTDLRLPGVDGLSLMDALRQNTDAPVIVMTAFSSVETAVDAMKRGAVDFLPKPFSLEHLSAVVRKALEVRSLRQENLQLKVELGKRLSFSSIVGQGPKMREILGAVAKVAPARTTILLCGESGVGKDLIARAIHHHSPRAAKPFVKINCTAIPESLMESELFGYEKGAFTGATAARPGKFEQADGGTVFLDEIGDVPLAVQVKLLRVLQERELERLGSNKTISIDVRVIAATNVDLRQALEDGEFREDLYYRLNVFPLTIPALRERREDIPALAAHFLVRLAAQNGRPAPELSAGARDALVDYRWPGNVRELENVLERSLLLSAGPVLLAEDIRFDAAPRSAPQPGNGFLPEGVTLDQHEQELIREALRRANGNKSQAARMLGMTRNALRYRLSQMGID